MRWICRQVTVTLGSLHMAFRGAGLTVITMGSHVFNLHVSVYDGRMHTRKKRKKKKTRKKKKKRKEKKTTTGNWVLARSQFAGNLISTSGSQHFLSILCVCVCVCKTTRVLTPLLTAANEKLDNVFCLLHYTCLLYTSPSPRDFG